MDDHHVEIIKSRLFQSLIDGCQGGLIGLVFCSDLGSHKDLFPRNAALPDSLSDAALVLIGLCRVDVANSEIKSCFDRIRNLLIWDHPDAESHLRNLHTIVQCQHFIRDHICPYPFRLSSFFQLVNQIVQTIQCVLPLMDIIQQVLPVSGKDFYHCIIISLFCQFHTYSCKFYGAPSVYQILMKYFFSVICLCHGSTSPRFRDIPELSATSVYLY